MTEPSSPVVCSESDKDQGGMPVNLTRLRLKCMGLAFALIFATRLFQLGAFALPNWPGAMLYAFITSGIIWLVLLLPAFITWRGAKEKPRAWAVFCLVPACLLSGANIYGGLPSTGIAITLDGDLLAPLPASAVDVQVSHWAGGFGFGVYIAFTASPEDVRAFIAHSRCLKDIEPIINRKGDHRQTGFGEPDWFKDAHAPDTRWYQAHGERGVYTRVIVDPRVNRVYVRQSS